MTHPLISRAHLEAVLVGLAAVRPELAPELLALVDVHRVSPAARTLLEAIDDDPVSAWEFLPLLAQSAGQYGIAVRAYDLSLKDLTFWPPATLVALVNQLPARAPRQAAWERDLLRAAS